MTFGYLAKAKDRDSFLHWRAIGKQKVRVSFWSKAFVTVARVLFGCKVFPACYMLSHLGLIQLSIGKHKVRKVLGNLLDVFLRVSVGAVLA